MNTAEQLLVIILAIALAVFLVQAIVIASQVIRLMKVLQDIAAKAQELANSAETTAELFKSTVGKLTVLRFARTIIDLATKHKTKE
jgi:cell division protein FtsB